MTAQTQTSLPLNGQIISFSKLSQDSYCSTGTTYRVERPKNKGDFHFVNVATGAGTFDRPTSVARAQWRAA